VSLWHEANLRTDSGSSGLLHFGAMDGKRRHFGETNFPVAYGSPYQLVNDGGILQAFLALTPGGAGSELLALREVRVVRGRAKNGAPWRGTKPMEVEGVRWPATVGHTTDSSVEQRLEGAFSLTRAVAISVAVARGKAAPVEALAACLAV